ncbi:MAG TPA: hypothetical protein VF337_00025 [Candidatus Limnocylindrales bacterium]
MSLRHQIGRVPMVRAAYVWDQRRRMERALSRARARPTDYHKAILTQTQGNSLICDALIAGRPYLAGRAGTVELDCITHYVKFRRGSASGKDYPESIVSMMGNNAGFFPAADDTLDRFSEEYLAAVRQVDAIAVWFNKGESDLAREFCPGADLIALRSLEPYYHQDPWSVELAGKRVLVIHPFADSISENYQQRRRLLFEDPRVLPEFELHVLKAVQSIAGEPTEFASWFHALDHMKAGMEAVDFDVCIVGAGAYGLPLAAHAKKLGKVAIHLGGATQILFGIRGGRWDNHEVISKLINEHWTRPRASETPRRPDKVEDGAYW